MNLNLGTAALILMLSVSYGCKKHAGCTKFGSENYEPDAVIDDGSCIHVTDKFIGSFSVRSDCFVQPYERTIDRTTEEFVVTITRIADTLGTAKARVYANNITIDRQTLRPGISVEGAGLFKNGVISLSYRIRDVRTGSEYITDCLETCTLIE